MANTVYVHHRIIAAPRRWRAVGDALMTRAAALAAAGGALYGAWRSQIGRPQDEVTAITAWSRPIGAAEAEEVLGADGILGLTSHVMLPTLRPSEATPPTRQGNYAFRWFVTPERDWSEFLELCAQAWPGFEAAYDSQVVGLWRLTGERSAAREGEILPSSSEGVASLLLTRRPDLAMWERSKLPQGAAEAAVRDALSRRYDLCDWTAVHTTTLISAKDQEDRARWA